MEDLDVSVIKRLVWGGCECSVEDLCTDVLSSICVQISVSLNKDEPDTALISLMRTKGADKVRTVLGSYVGFLKTGW